MNYHLDKLLAQIYHLKHRTQPYCFSQRRPRAALRLSATAKLKTRRGGEPTQSPESAIAQSPDAASTQYYLAIEM